MNELSIHQCIMTENDCFKAGKRITPLGIVVHSTGANNPNLCRYVGPDDGVIGQNKYDNHWNRPNVKKCVHAFIGKLPDGRAAICQTLPWDCRAWGVGNGKRGTYNDTHIQFEICEDDRSDVFYYSEAFDLAARLCAHLCLLYDLDAESVVGHYEAHAAGYANNHADPEPWQKKHDDSMALFRKRVAELIAQGVVERPQTVTLRISLNTARELRQALNQE